MLKNKKYLGACHADELSYLFYGQLFRFVPKPNSPEFKMCKVMSKLWTNFAKTGYVNKSRLFFLFIISDHEAIVIRLCSVRFDLRDPNSPDLNFVWHATKSGDPKYLSIDGDNTRMVDGLLFDSRMKFWDDISDMLRPEQ